MSPAALPLIAVAVFASTTELNASERQGIAAIDAPVIRAHTRFLSDDLLEGRGPATRGDALTQAYLAAQFEALGLEPAGTEGYFQPFDIVGVEGNARQMTVRGKGGQGFTLRHWDELVAVAGGPMKRSVLSNAELVFVGYGIQAPEYGWDDYKGLDVKGKVVVVMNNDPEHDPGLFEGPRRLWYGRWDYKYEQAAKMGAAGCIIIHTTPSASYPWQVVQTGWTGEQFELPAQEGRPMMQVKAWVTEEVAHRIMRLAGQDLNALRASAQTRDFKPVPLGVRVSTQFNSRVTTKRTANVLARLPGSDPRLSEQAVIYTAHHDHLGVSTTAKKGEDAIYNGALDNALGTASVLAVAKAFAGLDTPPRRSILFAAVAAEEQGLLGSRFLAEHLPVPSARLAANVNIDAGNIWGPTRDVAVVGHGKSDLDQVIAEVARIQGRVVVPDPSPESGGFYRSDQFNFARIGVPAAYFSGGSDVIGKPEGWGAEQETAWRTAHYHQPSDELGPDWDFRGAVQDAQLAFLVGFRVAQRTQLPAWTPGDEFEAIRKQDLREGGAAGR